MIERQGPCCPLCGYPVAEPGAELCDQCEAWQAVAAEAERAAELVRPAAA